MIALKPPDRAAPTEPLRSPLAQVEEFVLGRGVPAVGVLQSYRLASYGYHHLKKDDPRREYLKGDALVSLWRHAQVKQHVLELIRAWRAAGIDVLVWKGFYLAEFVYRSPAERRYEDVDVLVPPSQARAARAIARELEPWVEVWSRERSLYADNHEEARLDVPDVVRVELHRDVLDAPARWRALQTRYTEAAWASSSEVSWEGTTFRCLQPVDCLIMGLVLARSWSEGDDWALKPRDYLDFRAIVDTFGIARRELEARARELGCSGTLRLFLKRCDPYAARVSLQTPTALQRHVWALSVMHERHHLPSERALVRLQRLPGLMWDAARFLPLVLRTKRMLASGTTAEALVSAVDAPTQDRSGSLAEAERIARGVKWAALLAQPTGDTCMLRSVALFTAYRRRGYAVAFASGEATNDEREQVKHASVVLRGRSLRDMLSTDACRMERVSYRSDDDR